MPQISEKFKNMKDMEINLCYCSLNKLDCIIKDHKDRLSSSSNKNVVYKIQCRDCDAIYVGQMRRLLKTRIKKHRNQINRKMSNESMITQHIIDWNSHDF